MTVLYAWKNLEWDRWFYVGAGSESRAKDTKNRSKHFIDTVSSFDCAPYILLRFPDGTDTQTIEFVEKSTKDVLLSLGEPIYDAERECLHREAQLKGIAAAKAAGKCKGREPIKVDEKEFEAEYKVWRQGLVTAKVAMRHLDLKPNTFYRRVAKWEAEHGKYDAKLDRYYRDED